MTIDDAKIKQGEFDSTLGSLINYTPKAQKYIEAKNNSLDNAKNFYKGREKIIEGFKNGIFPLKSDDGFEEQQTRKKFNEKKPLITKLKRQELDEIERKGTEHKQRLVQKILYYLSKPK